MINTKWLDSFIAKNNQFPKMPEDSDLWQLIKMGTIEAGIKCTDRDAFEWAKTHCNSLSFYALCKAHGWIEFHYSTWVDVLLKSKLTSPDGYLMSKLKIAKTFGFDGEFNELKYLNDYDVIKTKGFLNTEKGYNIKVINNSGKGVHFMAGYVFDGLLYLSDSSSRGIHVKAEKVIPAEKFQWVLEV